MLSAHYLSYQMKVKAISSINLRDVLGEEKDLTVLQMVFFFISTWQNHQSVDEME